MDGRWEERTEVRERKLPEMREKVRKEFERRGYGGKGQKGGTKRGEGGR